MVVWGEGGGGDTGGGTRLDVDESRLGHGVVGFSWDLELTSGLFFNQCVK